MTNKFEELGISQELVKALSKAGINEPTPIQQQVIPLAMAGKDIIGQSPTGTGKTLAYLLPLFQKIDSSKREMQALILAPTHELSIQIQRQAELLAANSGLSVTSAPIIGNVNIMRQIEKLREKPHIIVGSSGRILELIQKKKINAATIKTIILDEADRLLDDQNIDSIKAVIKTTMRDRQMLLFSATITHAASARARELMNGPETVAAAGQDRVAPGIEHLYIVADQRDKMEALRKLARIIQGERGLVFVNKSEEIEITVAKLNYLGLSAAGIHGSSVKTDRKKALEDFRAGRIQLLVASDVAARGLDIPGVDYIFNLDLPEDPQVYLHRAGRTGRAGREGIAVSIVNQREVASISKIEKDLQISIAARQIAKGLVVEPPTRRPRTNNAPRKRNTPKKDSKPRG